MVKAKVLTKGVNNMMICMKRAGTKHLMWKSFIFVNMQSQRDLLEYLFNNVSTDREFLAESVNMLYRTFRYNIRILENGGSLKRQKGSGRPAKIVGDCKKRLSQIALKNPLFSTQNIRDRYIQRTGTSVSKATVYRTLKSSGITKKRQKLCPK